MPTGRTNLYQYRGYIYYPTVSVNVLLRRPDIEGGDQTVYTNLVALYSETKEDESLMPGAPGQVVIVHFTFQCVPLPDITPEHTIICNDLRFDVKQVLINRTRSTPVLHCQCEKVRYDYVT